MVKRILTIGICAAVLVSATAASAQSASAPAAKKVTLIGCVETEKDYRAKKAEGRGGALGTGVGVGNEYILTSVSAASGPTGTSGTASTPWISGDLRLSGKFEPTFVSQVGRLVEVIGTVEAAKEQPVKDVADLPKFTVEVWHTSKDFCPAKPAAK